jgi:EAL domain-containing protein (putative c-di-GMP-specific phosphodiesterase class I)
MRHAEVARDLALRSRSGLEVYSEDRNAFTDRRLAVLRGLGPALRRREMRVHFQPQVDIADRRADRLRGAAALGAPRPRPGPAGRVRGPGRARRDDVGDHRVRARRVAAAARRLAAPGLHATVSVNVSASVLQDLGLPGRVARGWRCGACRARRWCWS